MHGGADPATRAPMILGSEKWDVDGSSGCGAGAASAARPALREGR